MSLSCLILYPCRGAPKAQYLQSDLVEQCQALERRTFPQTEALQLRNELRKPNTYLVVAFEKPQPLVVGYALFSLIKCEATARLTKLAVKKSHRNRGIGSRVVQYVLAQVTRLPTPIARAMLHVDPSRREAHRLYRRLGFHTVTTLSDYYGAGRNADILERRVHATGGIPQ